MIEHFAHRTKSKVESIKLKTKSATSWIRIQTRKTGMNLLNTKIPLIRKSTNEYRICNDGFSKVLTDSMPIFTRIKRTNIRKYFLAIFFLYQNDLLEMAIHSNSMYVLVWQEKRLKFLKNFISCLHHESQAS